MAGIVTGTVSDPAVAVPQYRRIHVEHQVDFPRLYQVLESYITNPELALTVKEIVVSTRKLSDSFCCFLYPKPDSEPWIAAETNRNISEEHIMYRGVKQLNLSSEREVEWVKALSWMKPELVEQRKAPMEPGRVEYHFERFVSEKDLHFAYRMTALLLMLCPNVERLVYRDHQDLLNPVQEVLRRNNYDMIPDQRLQKLKEVVLLSTDDMLFGDERFYVKMDILDLLRMFHRLPSIESVSTEAIENDEEHDTFPPGTSNIKSISITHSMLGSDTAAALIRAPKALEKLVLTTGGRASSDGGSPLMFAQEIGKALLCQKGSLTELDLDFGPYAAEISMYYEIEAQLAADLEDSQDHPLYFTPQNSDFQMLEARELKTDETEAQGPLRAMKLSEDRPYGVYGETIGSLHDFEKLTNLSIHIYHLRELPGRWRQDGPPPAPFKLIDALPPNLEYLLIRGYSKDKDKDLDDEIEEVLRLKSERFPRLEQIHGVDELIAEGKTVGRPDQHPELLYRITEVEQGWLEHTHDEL